jgi:hypothetical protein
MVLRGRRVVEWVRGRGVGPGVVTNQRAEHLWDIHIHVMMYHRSRIKTVAMVIVVSIIMVRAKRPKFKFIIDS